MGSIRESLKRYISRYPIRRNYMGSRGLLGGILTFWEENIYHMINYEINESWVGVTLRLLKGKVDFVIVNVYSPQALQE